jgi:L-alanine-DL-glutamate epimerase-like enolase superfamily enzyme
MKITDIEIIPIRPRLYDRNRTRGREIRFSGINQRTIFRVHTDNGLVGYGDLRCAAPPRSTVESLIGCSPFDFVHSDFNPGLGGALYDVMGKHLDVPANKLMGQKVRDAVSCAAWTARSSPADFAGEIKRAALQGYRVCKMHTGTFYDVVEQTKAAEEVAPEGFRLHFDFNGNRSLSSLLATIRELEDHPIVGYIEDPVPKKDLDGWCRLRDQVRIPLVFHVPLGFGGLYELGAGVADTYLFSGMAVGETLISGFACARANTQTLRQLTGGTLTKAFALHIAAVLPTATGHSIHLDDQYADDIVCERIPVKEGSSPVREGPGLGIEVDEDALAQLAADCPKVPEDLPRHVGIVRLPDGSRLYTSPIPPITQMTGREEVRGIGMDLWEDDSSEKFEQIFQRLEKDGPFEVEE